MNAMTRTVLIAVVSNIILLFVNAQPLVSGDCGESDNTDVVEIVRLEHGHSVSLDYQPGQQVTLAGDAGGSDDLVGNSVVSIAFEPSGKGLGYGVESESLPVQDVQPLLVPGHNAVRLVAVNPADDAWLTVRTPCPPLPVVEPTATWVLVPTATPASAIEDAIIAATPEIRHTEETVNSGQEHAPVMDSGTASAGDALMGRMGRILTGMVLLGLVLLFALGKPRLWALWLRERVSRVDLTVAMHSVRGWWHRMLRLVQRIDLAAVKHQLRRCWHWLRQWKRAWLG